MTTLEALRQKLHAAIDAETSEARLRDLEGMLDHTYPLVPEGVEERLARGFADAEAGRVMSLEDFLEHGKKEAERRKAKYQ